MEGTRGSEAWHPAVHTAFPVLGTALICGSWSGMLRKLLAAPQPHSLVCRLPRRCWKLVSTWASAPGNCAHRLRRAMQVPGGQTAGGSCSQTVPQTVTRLLALYHHRLEHRHHCGCDSPAKVCSLGSRDSRRGSLDLRRDDCVYSRRSVISGPTHRGFIPCLQ